MWTLNDVAQIINELEEKHDYPKGKLTISESKRLKTTLAQFVHVVDYSDIYLDLTNKFPTLSNDDFGLRLDECLKDLSLEIIVSTQLLRFATYDQLKEVLIHEYAHYCNNIYHGGSGHDSQFRQLVLDFGGVNVHSDFGIDSDPAHPLVMEELLYVVHCNDCDYDRYYTIKTKFYKSVLAHEEIMQCKNCGSKKLEAYSGIFICEY